MEFILDLSNIDTERYFIVGDLLGDYDRLINMLYQQKFSYKDTLIFTGNLINPEMEDTMENEHQLSSVLFLRNSMNAYSVKGKNEFSLIRKIQSSGMPKWLESNPKNQEIIKFIDELPLIIRVSDSIFVVNAGVQPDLSMGEQDKEVFYSIGDYDEDSRFYQFDNPERKSWYEFEIYDGSTPSKFCFGGKGLSSVEQPAGYSLGRSSDGAMMSLVVRKNKTDPIIIQS